jgi:hypothetical protein
VSRRFPSRMPPSALAAVNTMHMAEEEGHAECLLLQGIGMLRLGAFADAKELVREVTMTHPAFMRGVALREVLVKRVSNQGVWGLVGIVCAVVVVGLVTWYVWPRSESRPQPKSYPTPSMARTTGYRFGGSKYH